MHLSQNAFFTNLAVVAAEDDGEPAEPIILMLRERLPSMGWATGQWYPDHGSAVADFINNGEEVMVKVALVADDRWWIQVCDASMPGVIGRILGQKRSASAAAMYALSSLIHDTLLEEYRPAEYGWCWDDSPDGPGLHERPPVPTAPDDTPLGTRKCS